MMPTPGNQVSGSHVQSHTEHPIPTNHISSRSSPVPRGVGGATGVNRSTAVVTIDTGDVDDDIDGIPESKRMKLMTSAVSQSKRLVPGLSPGIPLSNSQSLSNSEVSAVRQLITGMCGWVLSLWGTTQNRTRNMIYKVNRTNLY